MSKQRLLGIIFSTLGVVMLLAALLVIHSYQRREISAGQFSTQMLHEFAAGNIQPEAPEPTPVEPFEDAAEEEDPEPVISEMATADYYGLSMIGVVRVPSCGIELPVLNDWNYTILDYAPCRYSGNIYAGDLVVMGHNYTTHFKPLKKVEIGAEVEFETIDGTVWRYTVETIDSVHRDEPEMLPSEHELILFTCEEYGVYRFVARCSLVDIEKPTF